MNSLILGSEENPKKKETLIVRKKNFGRSIAVFHVLEKYS